jgi:hypothetical protein
VPSEVAAPRPGGLEDDLAAILGMGPQDQHPSYAAKRRFGLPVFGALLLVAASSAGILYLSMKPQAEDHSTDRVAGLEVPAPAVAPPAIKQAPIEVPNEETRVASPGPVTAPVPQLSSTARSPAAPARTAAVARAPAPPASRVAAKSAEIVRGQTDPTQRPSSGAKVAATERPIVRIAPPTTPPDQADGARPGLPEREQLASADATSASPSEAVPASDVPTDRATRRKDKQRKERKVIESFDAMRMLRRQ